jgi:hypothetical protein
MFRAKTALAALGLLAAASASAVAQDRGGVSLRNSPGAVLNRVESLQPGCPLSQTNIAVGVNRAMARGATAQQNLVANGGTCRPLVSTQVAAGVNLALGQGSAADQSIDAHSPRGLLGTTNYARGVNIAAGRGSAATQRIFGTTGR